MVSATTPLRHSPRLALFFLLGLPLGLTISGPDQCDECQLVGYAKFSMKIILHVPYTNFAGQKRFQLLHIPDTAITKVLCPELLNGVRRNREQQLEIVWYDWDFQAKSSTSKPFLSTVGDSSLSYATGSMKLTQLPTISTMSTNTIAITTTVATTVSRYPDSTTLLSTTTQSITTTDAPTSEISLISWESEGTENIIQQTLTVTETEVQSSSTISVSTDESSLSTVSDMMAESSPKLSSTYDTTIALEAATSEAILISTEDSLTNLGTVLNRDDLQGIWTSQTEDENKSQDREVSTDRFTSLSTNTIMSESDYVSTEKHFSTTQAEDSSTLLSEADQTYTNPFDFEPTNTASFSVTESANLPQVDIISLKYDDETASASTMRWTRYDMGSMVSARTEFVTEESDEYTTNISAPPHHSTTLHNNVTVSEEDLNSEGHASTVVTTDFISTLLTSGTEADHPLRSKRQVPERNILLMTFKDSGRTFYLNEVRLEFKLSLNLIPDLNETTVFVSNLNGLRTLETPLRHTYSCSSDEQFVFTNDVSEVYLNMSEIQLSVFMETCEFPERWSCNTRLPFFTDQFGTNLVLVCGTIFGASVLIGTIVHVIRRHLKDSTRSTPVSESNNSSGPVPCERLTI